MHDSTSALVDGLVSRGFLFIHDNIHVVDHTLLDCESDQNIHKDQYGQSCSHSDEGSGTFHSNVYDHLLALTKIPLNCLLKGIFSIYDFDDSLKQQTSQVAFNFCCHTSDKQMVRSARSYQVLRYHK